MGYFRINLAQFGAALLVVGILAGCADILPSSCPAGLEATTQAELFFGRGMSDGGQVNDDDWRRFVDEEITPRFPDGFSVQDATGHWKGANGIVCESSKRVTVVLSGAADEQARLGAIREAYKRSFHQDSVLLSEQRVCAGF